MMRKIVVPLLIALFMGSLLVTLPACSTVEGIARDVQQGGEAIRDEAKEIKKQM